MKFSIVKATVLTAALLAVTLPIYKLKAQSKKLLFPEAPGIESYTFRSNFTKDVPATLDIIRNLGIKDIEFSKLYGLEQEALRKMLDERGLKCSVFGTGWNDVINKTTEVAVAAKALGAQYIHLGSIPHKGPALTPGDAQNAVAEFNRVGKLLKTEYGLELLYHNHGDEFAPYENGTLYDYMVQNTNPEYVSFELDILWAYLPGMDPARLINTYPQRYKALHLKDLKKDVARNTSGKTDHDNNVVLGAGQIDIPAVIKAARQAGIQHYYLEDESSLALEQVPLSIQYLKNLKK
ncbi:sugar phosphate isomerase/epimerase [Mucilaginibacter sp. Bleaf8]|uniref:sugar phosphate isomerase/epimerase family protein n=1 Tax=Mucilaginibacter sp. Bleaf8 TaxID=2834430 RepID=UPI001BCE4E6B|nr:sugar phosphate isomerase/epimerase [Mucilaginibacter sp. Bleaf8]MBS7564706.1 sugar phosphate isomerase/epimerase [Mucilaginibacter sp. Bleaf8]